MKSSESVSPVYRVGDAFRISTRRLATSGTITQINRVNLLYDSVYMTGEILHLKIPRAEMVHADIVRHGVGMIQKAQP